MSTRTAITSFLPQLLHRGSPYALKSSWWINTAWAPPLPPQHQRQSKSEAMLWPQTEQHTSSGSVGYLLRTSSWSTEKGIVVDYGGLSQTCHNSYFGIHDLNYVIWSIFEDYECSWWSWLCLEAVFWRLWWRDVPGSPGPFSHEVHDHGFRAVHVLHRARQENDPGNVRQLKHLEAILTKVQRNQKSIRKLWTWRISSLPKSIQNPQDDNKKLDCVGLDECRLIFQWWPVLCGVNLIFGHLNQHGHKEASLMQMVGPLHSAACSTERVQLESIIHLTTV